MTFFSKKQPRVRLRLAEFLALFSAPVHAEVPRRTMLIFFAFVATLILGIPQAMAIDSCLVGTWEAISYKQANEFVTGGGTGFRVTIKPDGTETIDYSSMQPVRAGNDRIIYSGTATARISADKGVAKLESIEQRGVTMTTDSPALKVRFDQKLTDLGPGGLGTA